MALLAGAVVTVAAWHTGDWWRDDSSGFATNLTIARLVMFSAVSAIAWAAPSLLRRSTPVGRWVFAFWVVYLGIWLVGQWPGIVMTDGSDVVVKAREGMVYEWYSYLHSLIHLILLDVVPHVSAVGVTQVLLTAATLAYASSLVYERSRSLPAVVVMNVLAACSAPVLLNTLMYSRDTLFSVGQVFLALYVARAVAVRKTVTPAGLVGIALLTAVLSQYRGDGVILLAVVPLILLAGLRPDRRAVIRGAAVFGAAVVLVHALLPWPLAIREHALPHVEALEIREHPRAYELSLRLNPLGDVLRSSFYSTSREADLRALGRVIDLQKVQEWDTATEIPILWEGHWRPNASTEEYDAFFTVADRLLRDNLVTVLSNRVETFGNSTALTGPGGFTGTHLASESSAARDDWWYWDPEGMRGSPPVEGLYEVQADLLRASGKYEGLVLSGSALHWNFLPWLLLLTAAAVLWRRATPEAVVSGIIICRVPLVFAAAPAAQFKYYYAVVLGGIVVLGLLLGRLRTPSGRPHRERHAPANLSTSPGVPSGTTSSGSRCSMNTSPPMARSVLYMGAT